MLFKKLCLKANQIVFFYLWFVLIFVSTSSIAYSATYYVSPNGNASWEEALKITTPCSAQTAMQNAQAGDIVYFRGGQYELAYAGESDAALEPSHSGTNGNLITFIAYSGETPVLNGDVSVHDITHVLGNNSKNYIVFDGFKCQANNGTKRAKILMSGGTECIVKNCDINGGSTITTSTDNREGLRLDGTTNILIQDCTIYNFRQTDNWSNTCAVKMYGNDYTIIENCEIYNCSNGIYAKNGNDNCLFRYNYIHSCYRAFKGSTAAGSSSYHDKIYQNVFANNEYTAIEIVPGDGLLIDDLEIYNNTIYNSVRGISYSVGQSKIWNNIVQGCANMQYTGNYDGSILNESDHNQFGAAPLKIITRLYAGDQGTYTSLSTWKSSGELDSGWDAGCGVSNNPGCGSLASDPRFLNPSGTMSQLDDFRLAEDSPCKGAGRGGGDMGADISQVGSGVNPSPPGSPPGVSPWFEKVAN